jgi:hypothetical protein
MRRAQAGAATSNPVMTSKYRCAITTTLSLPEEQGAVRQELVQG